MNNRNGQHVIPLRVTRTSAPAYGGFGVTQYWIGRTAVVAVSGDLDMVTGPEVAAEIDAAARQGPEALIVDLSDVQFLASAGMTLLITARRDVVPAARFGVVADGSSTSRPLKMIGVDTVVTVYRTLGDALDGSDS